MRGKHVRPSLCNETGRKEPNIHRAEPKWSLNGHGGKAVYDQVEEGGIREIRIPPGDEDHHQESCEWKYVIDKILKPVDP